MWTPWKQEFWLFTAISPAPLTEHGVHICGMNKWTAWLPAQQSSSLYPWDNLSRDFKRNICFGTSLSPLILKAWSLAQHQEACPGNTESEALVQTRWIRICILQDLQVIFFSHIKIRKWLSRPISECGPWTSITSMTWELVRTVMESETLGMGSSNIRSKRFWWTLTFENPWHNPTNFAPNSTQTLDLGCSNQTVLLFPMTKCLLGPF